MGKTRDFFRKIGGMKGIFHARVGMIKDRNSKDLTEVKRLRRCCKNTQKNSTKKVLNDPDNHSAVITHLEPGILECEVMGFRNITINKASGGDGIPADLFQILKDDAVKVPHTICQQF